MNYFIRQLVLYKDDKVMVNMQFDNVNEYKNMDD